MERIYLYINRPAAIMVVLSVLLFGGFLVTRLTKRAKLPNVTGYILAGIGLGPCALGLVPGEILENMEFVSDMALACIAFGVGKYFTRESLQKAGAKTMGLTLAESLPAGVLVALVTRLAFKMDWSFSLLLGAVATATAPASTMMTISQYGAKGEFVDVLLQVVALDDAVCLLAFSVAAAAISAGGVRAALLPLLYNVAALVLGAGCGLLLGRLLAPATRSRENRLILTIALLLALTGVCTLLDVSPLLACMVFSAVYRNHTDDVEIYRELEGFTPPIMALFFIISGMNLQVNALGQAGLIGVVYFILRIVGKYGGAYGGSRVLGYSAPIQNNLGLALIPQAGVALGLAFLGRRILPPAEGELLFAVILSSSVLYELAGPPCAKLALLRSGAIPKQATRHGQADPGNRHTALEQAACWPQQAAGEK